MNLFARKANGILPAFREPHWSPHISGRPLWVVIGNLNIELRPRYSVQWRPICGSSWNARPSSFPAEHCREILLAAEPHSTREPAFSEDFAEYRVCRWVYQESLVGLGLGLDHASPKLRNLRSGKWRGHRRSRDVRGALSGGGGAGGLRKRLRRW